MPNALDFAPPASVRASCLHGLALAKSLPAGQAPTKDVIGWAEKLATGEKATPERIRAMKAWMARHAMSARRADAKSRDAALFSLWGGEDGRKWAERIAKQLDAATPEAIAAAATPSPRDPHKSAAAARAKEMRAKAFELSSTKLAANDIPDVGERDAEGYLCHSWVQVAKIGTYKGHPAGDFEFTSEVFDQMIANHATNPNGIVPFDYEHGSEAMGTSVYQDGAPAVGWIKSLENRGDEGLYAFVGWVDEECVGYIRKGRYKFVSPAVVFGAVHPESGEDMGPVLVSAAVTNRPFLQGMRPLTARADAHAEVPPMPTATAPKNETEKPAAFRANPKLVQLSADDMNSRDRLIESLRSIFGLPELSPEADVLAALDRLEDLIDGDSAEKEGIDVGSIIESLRWCFRLPRLTSAAEVLETIRKGLASASSTAAAPPASTSARAMSAGGQTTSQEPVMEKTAEHTALEAAHADLSKKHTDLTAKHAAFKGAICKAMKMAEDSEDQAVVDALDKKMQAADLAAKEAAEREQTEAANDVDMVAARLGVTDEAGKAGLVALRANKSAFRATFGAILQSAPAPKDGANAQGANPAQAAAPATANAAPAATPAANAHPTPPSPANPPAPPPPAAIAAGHEDAAWMRLMSGRVAPQGGPAPSVAPAMNDTDRFYSEVGQEQIKLCRENPAYSDNPVLALDTATRVVKQRWAAAGAVAPR